MVRRPKGIGLAIDGSVEGRDGAGQGRPFQGPAGTLMQSAFSALPLAGEAQSRRIIDALPTPLYTTDACGRITYFNEAAATLWGRRPRLGEEFWCGSWKLFWPDGRPMAHEECPMALTIKTGRPVKAPKRSRNVRMERESLSFPIPRRCSTTRAISSAP